MTFQHSKTALMGCYGQWWQSFTWFYL